MNAERQIIFHGQYFTEFYLGQTEKVQEKIEYVFKIINSFKLFGLKRKLAIFCPIEVFFELHSIATEGKKTKSG